MSTLTSRIFGYRAAADRVIVPPPTEPMRVAHEFVQVLYTNSGGLLLRHYQDNFYRWTGTCWPVVAIRDVSAAVYRFLEHAQYVDPHHGLKAFAPTRKKVEDVIHALRAVINLESSKDLPMWIDSMQDDPPASEVVSMANGLLHLPTRTLIAHTPRFFNQHGLPFPYITDAPAPARWMNFLRELWQDDEQSIATLQEVIGYILSGDTRLQKIIMLVGPARAGKGTIVDVTTELVGRHNVASPTLASFTTNFGLQALLGKRLATISDARVSNKADRNLLIERLLSISGEDRLTVDRKHRDHWTGRLPTRFMIATNELPHLPDASGAFASRFIVLVLTRTFSGRENPKLKDELLAEAPSIFNWGLEGLDRLNARGYFINPNSSAEAIRQFEDQTSPVGAFVRDCCVIGHYHVMVDQLWGAWEGWCRSNHVEAGTKETFGRKLRTAVPTLKRVKPRSGGERVYAYEGIGLKRRPMNRSAADLGPSGPASDNGVPAGPSGPRTTALADEQARFRFNRKRHSARSDVRDIKA
jgi:putative DNA primase/helicase